MLDAAGALGPLVLIHFKLFEGLAVLVRHHMKLLEEPRRVAAPTQIERRRAAGVYVPKRRQVVAPPVDDPEVVQVVVVLLRRVRAQVLALGPAPGCYGAAGRRGLLAAAAHDTACRLRASAAQRPMGASNGAAIRPQRNRRRHHAQVRACGFVPWFHSSFVAVRDVSGESLLGGLLPSAGSLDRDTSHNL